MSYKASYVSGDWKADCDVCGRTYKASSLRKRWDGLMVCRDDYEPRQPQDFVRGTVDTQVPAWTRPEPADTYTFLVGELLILESSTSEYINYLVMENNNLLQTES